MKAMRARGFTIIELLIAMVIAAILVMLVLPTYSEFMRNTRIRNTADSLATGIRLAQTEAIRRNQNIEFVVAAGTGWSIRDPITPSILHTEPFSDTAGQVVVTPSDAPSVALTYSPLGQRLPANDTVPGGDNTPSLRSIAVSHAVAPSRALRVITEAFGGGVRVCDNDPSVDATLRCPAAVP